MVAMETASYCVTYLQWTEPSALCDGEAEVCDSSGRSDGVITSLVKLLHSTVGAAVRCLTFIVSQDPNSECPLSLSHNMSYTLLSTGSLETELGGYPLVDCMRLLQQLLRLQVKTSTVH